MSKALIIVESPAKARTIEKFLGRRFRVTASMGHVRDLPKSQLGVDVEHGFDPKYITIRGKGDILKELRDQAKKADKVYLATDPDREGEAISWHLAQILGLSEADACRVEFHEITRDAVQKAIKHPRSIDNYRVEAQQARRILDRLVGYKLSPLLWRKVRRGLSAGRVQSVAVRLIADREAEISAFKPEEYWTLDARLATQPAGAPFQARYYGVGGTRAELTSEAETQDVIARAAAAAAAAGGQGAPGRFSVVSVRRREKRRHPAFPFTTSTLQQEASRKLGFSVRRTMAVAQQLYEGLDLGELGHVGLVTYIRTDSTRVAEEAQRGAADYIRSVWGDVYLPAERREAVDRPMAQGAHEAIRPTNVNLTPDQVRPYLSQDQLRLYRLIWERFVASQMAPAVMDTVTADIQAGDSANGAATATDDRGPQVFRATGSTLKFAGFMAVYIEGEDEQKEEEQGLLPDLTEGQALFLQELMPRQHFTQPPPRYTEAMLVRALEERAIGRPSTYAPIIETIQARGYVERSEKRFRPTELGDLVVDLLKEYFPDVIDVQFTAQMEGLLDRIAEGDANWRQVLAEFYAPFAETLRQAEEQIGGFELQDEVTDEPCPNCGAMLVVKYGRFGKFLACPNFAKTGCKFTKPILEETGVRCPQCHAGMLVQRKSKKGRRFYGCNRYPECDFVVWQKPVAERFCPECSGILVEKRTKDRGLLHACVREGCGYSEPVTDLEEVST